jgi:TfoX/Sxy family transcriptional regulator of competence genes
MPWSTWLLPLGCTLKCACFKLLDGMASKQTTVDFILEQMQGAGAVRAKAMFGEYAVYCDDKVVALVCDDQLFVKLTAAGRNFIGTATEGQPYPGAKACFLISGDQWEDREWLSQLIKLTALELPVPKPKKKSPPRSKT